MLTKEEFLKKIGKTEEELKAEGLGVEFVGERGYGDEDDGWDTYFIDPAGEGCVEIGLGCKCSFVPLSGIHDKL